MERNPGNTEKSLAAQRQEAQGLIDELRRDYESMQEYYRIAMDGEYDAGWAAELEKCRRNIKAAEQHLNSLE